MLQGALSSLARGARRMPLTAKHGNKNYYKGNRSGRMGHWTKWGGYVLEPWRFRQYVVPDLANCDLKPYVSPATENSLRKGHSLADYFSMPESFSEAPVLESHLQNACSKTAQDVLKRIRKPKKTESIQKQMQTNADNASVLFS